MWRYDATWTSQSALWRYEWGYRVVSQTPLQVWKIPLVCGVEIWDNDVDMPPDTISVES